MCKKIHTKRLFLFLEVPPSVGVLLDSLNSFTINHGYAQNNQFH